MNSKSKNVQRVVKNFNKNLNKVNFNWNKLTLIIVVSGLRIKASSDFEETEEEYNN